MDAVEEVKSRLSIEDVASEYVELKRAGRNFKALSPFSNEKTPSLMISPEKQIWHDFSSGKGGNIFSFVMEMEGVDFKTALEQLARKAGVDLGQFQRSGGGNTKLKERLLQAHDLAAKFYQVQFTRHREAIEYIVKQRKLDKQTILDFRIGYAPNNGDALTKFLLGKGFTVEELKKGGLSTDRYRGLSDMFRGRIMISLMDVTGNVIGFTGRVLEDIPNAPKYLNTPQTLLYDKSRHVFGLHLAKDTIRKSKFVVLVEGNMDVIASHQAGVKQCVATAGTAMTPQHLKALVRFTPDIRLSYDQDNAGLQAAERAIPIASREGANLSMINLDDPTAKDPDDLIQKDPKLWQSAVQKPQYALDWLMDRYQQQLDLNTAQGKKEFSSVIVRTIKSLNDEVEQEHYLEKVARLLGVSKDAMQSKLKGTTKEVPRRKNVSPEAVDKLLSETIRAQNNLLALTFMVPNTREYVMKLTKDMMPEVPAKELLEFIQQHPEYDGKSASVKPLKNIADYVKMLAVIFEELYQDLEILELRYEAARLQVRLIEQYVKVSKTVLAEKMRHAKNETETTKLLSEAKALDALLHLSNEGDANAETSQENEERGRSN
jgi:DNA primase